MPDRYSDDMSEHPWSTPEVGPTRNIGRTPAPRDPFSIEAYLDRQRQQFAGGPTMADILADLDQFRQPDGPTSDDIVQALHEERAEREEHLGNQ